MKIELNEITRMTIEEFADKHDLVMEINERQVRIGCASRYYASFKGSETKNGVMLARTYGNGSTPDMAISAYAEAISCKTLVIDSMLDTRREIEVPMLSYDQKNPSATNTTP